jgi:multicomponent Na+:H+ antiporter subunit F
VAGSKRAAAAAVAGSKWAVAGQERAGREGRGPGEAGRAGSWSCRCRIERRPLQLGRHAAVQPMQVERPARRGARARPAGSVPGMDPLVPAVAILFVAGLAGGLVRIVRGPSREDRMLAAQLFGTTGVAVLLLLAETTGQASLRDVALVFTVLATVNAAVFVRHGRRRAQLQPARADPARADPGRADSGREDSAAPDPGREASAAPDPGREASAAPDPVPADTGRAKPARPGSERPASRAP